MGLVGYDSDGGSSEGAPPAPAPEPASRGGGDTPPLGAPRGPTRPPPELGATHGPARPPLGAVHGPARPPPEAPAPPPGDLPELGPVMGPPRPPPAGGGSPAGDLPELGPVMGPPRPPPAGGGTPAGGPRVFVCGAVALRDAVRAHPALQWADDLLCLCDEECVVLQFDPEDETAELRCEAAGVATVWLPISALLSKPERAAGGEGPDSESGGGEDTDDPDPEPPQELLLREQPRERPREPPRAGTAPGSATPPPPAAAPPAAAPPPPVAAVPPPAAAPAAAPVLPQQRSGLSGAPQPPWLAPGARCEVAVLDDDDAPTGEWVPGCAVTAIAAGGLCTVRVPGGESVEVAARFLRAAPPPPPAKRSRLEPPRPAGAPRLAAALQQEQRDLLERREKLGVLRKGEKSRGVDPLDPGLGAWHLAQQAERSTPRQKARHKLNQEYDPRAAL